MGKYKNQSAFKAANLDEAVALAEEWERKFRDNDPEIKPMMEYVQTVIDKSYVT